MGREQPRPLGGRLPRPRPSASPFGVLRTRSFGTNLTLRAGARRRGRRHRSDSVVVSETLAGPEGRPEDVVVSETSEARCSNAESVVHGGGSEA